MARFQFRAVRLEGETLDGEREAPDLAALRAQLQHEGLLVLELRPAGGLRARLRARARRRLGRAEVTALTRQLATLLESGMALDRALQILIELAAAGPTTRVLGDLQQRVRGGASFSTALAEQDGQFSRLYVSMVRAGEAGGALDRVLGSLADYLERIAELRQTVISALVYPAILVTVAGLTVALLLIFVVPQFAGLFADMGATLPRSTRILIGLGELLRDHWWVLLCLPAPIALALERWLEDPARRVRLDRRLLGLPLAGALLWRLETARLCHTLATLLGNGLPLAGALDLAREVVTNRALAERLEAAGDELRRGRGLAGPLARHQALPPLALQMVRVGEESGGLEPVLAKVATIYDRETRAAVQRLLALLEPALILGLGVVVAGIILSILGAILGANALVV
ncbi:type II secretion system F family protein [Marichromatium sp. PS1]|uniref:type II secretion system F family protein n=1 Tax=Marichromatium sp. PS1 TaxID=3138932 RepID=UPI0032E779D1